MQEEVQEVWIFHLKRQKLRRKNGVLHKTFYCWKRKMQVNSFLSLAVCKDISQDVMSSGCGMVMREFPKS